MATTSAIDEVRSRAAGWRLRVDMASVMIAATSVLLGVLVVLPFGWLAYYAVTTPEGAVTLDNFAALVNDPALSAPIVTTLTLAICVSLASVTVATPLAWLVARSDMPARRTMRALMTASFVTPPFLGAIAWEILAAPNSGILNRL